MNGLVISREKFNLESSCADVIHITSNLVISRHKMKTHVLRVETERGLQSK